MDFKPINDELNDPNTIVNHIKEMLEKNRIATNYQSLFKKLTANEWLKLAMKTPISNMLFGELWHEGEICILFSDSNLGKSILAVQIGDSISKGKQILGLKLETDKKTVLYYDFELTLKQFESRYSVKNEELNVFEKHYCFDDNFIRLEIHPDAEIPDEISFEDYLIQSIEHDIIETIAKELIIDNITYLKNETERAKEALPLMKLLKKLKNKYGLSILVLAHTPKRDLSRPITQNDLGGSKMLYNFTDSCFAIGQSSSDTSLRYIKQIKARNTQIIYDTENVLVCQIIKNYNFLSFEFIGFGTEREHLKQITEKDRVNIIDQVKELSTKGNSQREISKILGISVGSVNNYLNKK